MKKVIVSLLLATVLAVSAFRGAEMAPPDFLSTLALSQDAAEDFIFQSFWSDYVSHPSGQRVRAVAVGDRPAMVREVARFARDYFASPRFREAYRKAREDGRPTPPAGPKTGEELIKGMKAEMEAQIAEMEAQIKQAPPDLKPMLEATLASMKEQLAQLDDPNHPFRDPSMQAMVAEGAAANMAAYEQELAEWERVYPADPTPRIAARLEEILGACSDVDFSARLVDGDGGKKLFADPAHEHRPPEWKACFRAGPEALEAARSALGDWLAEIR